MERSLSIGFSLIRLMILPTAQAVSTAEPVGAITPDNPASVQAGIVAAFRAVRKSVVVPAGIYHIAPTHDRWHLEFAGFSNFDIDARGAIFLWQDRTKGGIHFHGCKNLRLR